MGYLLACRNKLVWKWFTRDAILQLLFQGLLLSKLHSQLVVHFMHLGYFLHNKAAAGTREGKQMNTNRTFSTGIIMKI